MANKEFLAVIVGLLSLTILSCSLPAQTVATPAPRTPAAVASRPGWQEDWEKTLGAAQSEGKVVVLTTIGGAGLAGVAGAFKNRFGIDTEFLVAPSGQMLVKVSTERRAGLYLGDVSLMGQSSLVEFAQPGFLDPLRPLLVLPEVTETRNWWKGELFFHDKDGLMLGYLIKASPGILVNRDVVKPEDIKSYHDLLEPKWKGKIVVLDPSKGSAGTYFFLILWEIMGPDFTRELSKQDLAITADSRQQVEWLARGKYPVSGNANDGSLNEFVAAGAPLRAIVPAEGTLTTASLGGMSLMNKAPHPNAAKVFVNWLLGKEGQTIMTKVIGAPSRRVDVSYEPWDPALIVKPGVRYIDSDTEELRLKRLELQKTSKEIWKIEQ